MKKIVPEFVYSAEQLNIIRSLANECNLCEDTVKILYGRGLKDKKSIYDFMHPSKSHFITPFKMSGMKEAVELITRARDEEWAVVVYGDYDADGICASTVLFKALKDFGIEPYVCVPERSNGYGLSQELIDGIFDEYFPQLFITVDCGISCRDEVEYIKEMGAEVIVTDHHELPEELPDCICINPKFSDDYIYDNLCGAGVAFKLACALIGERAYNYLDFTAIATVADSVPLTGENRDIVAEGLKLINGNPAKCYSHFINKPEGTVTAHVLAFTIAPKINAAGRMGDAKSALTLFNETDESKIYDLAVKLTEYNIERQKYCDELYTSAKEHLKSHGRIGNVIMLCDENWNSGFVGIVAARLADEYSRPVILFVKNGDMLKGSARSVESVNIFEALKACSEYIAEFGGHSQAAGVNVSEDNFENLSKALNAYIGERYSKEDFISSVYVNGTLDGEYSARFAKELELLEPFGVGNRRPLFVTEERSLSVRAVKTLSNHISIKSDKIELMYFGGGKFVSLLESSAPKKLVFEYNVSTFRGKEYVKGFVRDVIYDSDAGGYAGEEIALCLLDTMSLPEVECEKYSLNLDETEKITKCCGDFGTVFIAYNYSSAQSLKNASNLDIDLFVPSERNNSSCILLAPSAETDLSGYSRIIFLDEPCGIRLPSLTGKRVGVCSYGKVHKLFSKIICDRVELLKIFAALSSSEQNIEGASPMEVAAKNNFGYGKLQTLFALKVFEQLSLVSFESGRLKVIRGVKSDLKNSEIFNTITQLQAE